MNRILAISHTPIWPLRSGSAIRRLMTVEALATLGPVDLLYVGEASGLGAHVPDAAPISGVRELPVARRRLTATQRLLWSLRPTRPLQVLEWQPKRANPIVPGRSYDLAWYFRPVAYHLTSHVDARRTVVDLDDLEDVKLRLARATRPGRGSRRRRFAERRNATAWARYQRQVASDVDAVVVCSDEDRRALGLSNVHVVPNGFPDVGPRSGRPEAGTMLLVGLFDYEPNADAAEFMVHGVLPRILRSVPDAHLRLVGRTTPRVERLAGPHVTVVGEVPDLAPEYERAAISVAPIRFGGGTRIKILESFAREVPVVSTTMGAAGLGACSDQELLLADDEKTFAAACATLLSDPHHGRRLCRAGHARWRSSFSQLAVTDAVVRAVGDGS